MQIFFELGNTRIKAASLEAGQYDFIGALEHTTKQGQGVIESFDIGDDVTQVFIASVAKAEITASLVEEIQKKWRIYPIILTTQPKCCGITCGYDAFDQLGVDRWMAIIGACAHSSKPTLIVDAGTAVTVDVVIDQQHLGGFIVPGLSLMRTSLVDGTDISLTNEIAEPNEPAFLAKNTENGILGGTLYMVASYLNSLISDMENETGRRFDCIGTGGDFKMIQPMLDKDFELIEDLIIQGMIEVIESV